MDESISVTSSGDSSGTSDDFEILDPTSPSSPVPVTLPASGSHASAASRKVPSSRDSSQGGTAATSFLPSNASCATPKMLSRGSNRSNSSTGEPQLAIANNGNIEDLQKQMSEVLRDAKSSSSDRITREDDPAILKSLDTSPESDISSPVSKTGRGKDALSSGGSATSSVALTTASSSLANAVVTTLAKSSSSSNGNTARGLSHPVREIVDHNHPLCLPSGPASPNTSTVIKETSGSKNDLSGGKSIPENTSTASKQSKSLTRDEDYSSNCTATDSATEKSNPNSSHEQNIKAPSSASSSTTTFNPATTTTSSSTTSTTPPPVSATTPTIENPPSEEYTIFNRVLYLGAASISSACTQTEIMHNMGILNSQVQGNAIEVSLSVPSHSEGHVIIYDALNKMEITKYHIYTIRRCTRGLDNTPDASCFTFTTKHGTSPATSIVQCHVFRCQIPEAVGRIVDSFGAAFRRVPKNAAVGGGGPVTGGMVAGTSAGAMTTSISSITTSAPLSYKFDIALEIKEEDSKGNYYTVPRDKECFKLRCNIDKEVQITVTPSPTTANSNGINNGSAQPVSSSNTSSLASSASSTTNGVGPQPVSLVSANVVAASSNGSTITAAPVGLADTLTIERCFGLLIAPGHKVKHADMNLLEMVSMGHSSNGGPPATSTAATTSTNTGGGGVNTASLPTANGGQSAASKSYVVSGRWDPSDPVFATLNQETPKDGRVLMSVAIDLVMKGIQEPVRFVLDTKVRVFPQNERFWYFTKKPLLHLFSLKLKQAELSPSSAASLSESQQYEVVSVDNLGEVERLRPSLAAGLTLPLTLSSLTASTLSSLSGGVRSPGTASVDTPGGDEDTDDDEPLLSGSGEVSKDCPQSELDQWKVVLPKWQAAPALFPKGLAKLVKRGVPEALRGEVWQLLAGCSRDTALMDGYRLLLTKDCPSDQVILRDINRTFPAHDFFKESGGGGQDALYKISRAYAVYDEELAYCQGLSFLAASLLLHMPEEQAFCVLVKIMSDYGFRNLFKDGFEVLHLRFYQLDRLMEDYLSDVHSHFQEVGVATHMFASQWFLTLYTAKFPLYMVFHYLDLFLLLGFDSVFQVAIALLMMSRKELVALDFEGVLKYFRVSLPKKYRSEENVKQLFRLATSIKVKRLEKYQREYLAIKEQESSENVSERLEQENRRLLEEKLRLDAENDILARKIDQLEESGEKSSREVTTLKQALAETDQEKTRLMQEASQVKDLLKREVERSDGEQRRSTTLVAEYKTICSQLSQRLEDEHSGHIKAIHRIRSRLDSCSAPGCRCLEAVCPDGSLSDRQDSLSSTDSSGGPATDPLTAAAAEDTAQSRRAKELSSLSHQVRELELELAQTKLALVETQCKNQDVTHQLNSAITELQSSQNTWFQKTLTSITSLREKPANNSGGGVTATGGSSSRPLSPSLSTQTINSLSSLGSSSGGGGGGRATVNRTSSIDSNSSVSSRKDVAGTAP